MPLPMLRLHSHYFQISNAILKLNHYIYAAVSSFIATEMKFMQLLRQPTLSSPGTRLYFTKGVMDLAIHDKPHTFVFVTEKTKA